MTCSSAQLFRGTIDLFLYFILLASQPFSGFLWHFQLFFAGHSFAEFSQSFLNFSQFIVGLLCKS